MNDKENCAEKRGKQYRSDRASPSFFRRFIFWPRCGKLFSRSTACSIPYKSVKVQKKEKTD